MVLHCGLLKFRIIPLLRWAHRVPSLTIRLCWQLCVKVTESFPYSLLRLFEAMEKSMWIALYQGLTSGGQNRVQTRVLTDVALCIGVPLPLGRTASRQPESSQGQNAPNRATAAPMIFEAGGGGKT
jgi:hypothetical protein